MWFWDFTPASGGRAKPVTKAALRKKREDYARAEAIARESLEQEKLEQENTVREMDELLGEIF